MEVFTFYVNDDRTIKYRPLEPIMQEDKDVAVWRFRIPKVLNQIDMSNWAWWFVYVNAKGQKYSESLTLVDDLDEPDSYSTADYSIDYGISKNPGGFTFAIEAINTQQGGEITGEWHTYTYSHKVIATLQGNQAEFAETESDIISALIAEVQSKVNALVGGATPQVVSSVSAMTDTSKIYVLSTDGNWYYYNGSAWVSGGQYASGITIDPTLTQSGQAADAGAVGSAIANTTGIRHLPFIDGYYSIPVVGGVVNTSVITANDIKCAIGLISAGEVLYVRAQGRGMGATYAFVDSSYTVLQRAIASEHVIDASYIAPLNSAYVIVNTVPSYDANYCACIGNPVAKDVYNLRALTRMPALHFANYIYFMQDGKWAYVANRVGTGEVYYTPVDIYAWCDSVHQMSIMLFTSSIASLETFIRSSGWVQKFLIPAGSYYLVNYSRRDSANLNPPEAYSSFYMSASVSDSADYVIDSAFSKRKVATIYEGTLTYGQSFCKYNNKYYSTNGSNIGVQDASFTALLTTAMSVGHGNAFQLGDNGKAYISGWDDNNVYIVDLTGNTPVLDGSISLGTSGYTTAVIDALNGIAYIFQRDTRPNTEANYNFIVYDYINSVVKSTRIINKFGAMQAADLYNGKIAIMWGRGTAELPSGMAVYNTAGDMLAEYKLSIFANTEPEGICFDRDTGDLLVSMTNSKVYRIIAL